MSDAGGDYADDAGWVGGLENRQDFRELIIAKRFDDYDPEPDYDDEPPEPEIPYDEDAEDGEGGSTDPALRDATAGRTVVMGQDGTSNPRMSKRVPDDQRTTTPFLTKYERARVLGTRATQIA